MFFLPFHIIEKIFQPVAKISFHYINCKTLKKPKKLKGCLMNHETAF